MFQGFASEKDSRATRRRLVATLAALGVMGALGVTAWAVTGRAAPPPPAEDEPIDVTFAAKPKAAAAPPPVAAPPPPPAAAPPPADMPVRRVKPPKDPLAAPKTVSTAPLAEADPSLGPATAGEPGGEPGGEAGGQVDAPPPPPPPVAPPPPPPKPVRREPINLPENATPPVPADDNTMPEYPAAKRAEGVEALVILKIVVTERGTVGSVTVMRGEEPFAGAAVAAVKTWRFTPALVDGAATPVFRIIKIPFRITR